MTRFDRVRSSASSAPPAKLPTDALPFNARGEPRRQSVLEELRRAPLRVVERSPRHRATDESDVSAAIDELRVQRGIVAHKLAHLVEHRCWEKRVIRRAQEERGCADA